MMTKGFSSAAAWLGMATCLMAATLGHSQTYTVLQHLGGLTNYPGFNPRHLIQAPDGTLYGVAIRSSPQHNDGDRTHSDTIFSVSPDGSALRVLKVLTNSEGSIYGKLALSGAWLYGTTGNGGMSNRGTVFRLRTDGTDFAVLKDFIAGDGRVPIAGVTIVGSVLYGTTVYGTNDNSGGTIFRLNTDGNGFLTLKHFQYAEGTDPRDLVYSGGVLYGIAQYGGISFGTVFRINTDGTDFTVLKTFMHSEGSNPNEALVVSGNTLYGTTRGNYGTVFKLNTDGSEFDVLKAFPRLDHSSGTGTNTDGAIPMGGLTLAGGTLFGTTRYGGSSGYGTLFKIFTDGTGFTVLKDFTGFGGSLSALPVRGDTVYGATWDGGFHGAGSLFTMKTDGTGYADVAHFTGGPSWAPIYENSPSDRLLLEDGVLYGTASGRFGWAQEAIFKINTDGTGFSIVHAFSSETDDPNGPLVMVNGALFGTTTTGRESASHGSIFTVNPDGSGFRLLKTFPRADYNGMGGYTNSLGAEPLAGLTVSGGALYGTTFRGGDFGYGVIFKINPDGSGYTVLKHFTQNEGTWCDTSLVTSGNTLYGTTRSGGTRGAGTLFKINTDGNSFAVLKHFDFPAQRIEKLVLAGDWIFGVTPSDVNPSWGYLSKVKTDGSGYTILREFNYAPTGIDIVGSTIYGTSGYGGISNAGGIFKIQTDGTGYQVLHQFGTAVGSQPFAGVTASGGKLYGVTASGGERAVSGGHSLGVIFRLQDAEEGSLLVSGQACSTSDGLGLGGNPLDEYLWVGFERTAGVTREYRSALRFALPPTLDAGSIRSATLRLFHSHNLQDGGDNRVRAHRITGPWPAGGSVFTVPHESSFAETTVGPANWFGWVAWDVTDAARAWAADPAHDFALLLRSSPDGTGGGQLPDRFEPRHFGLDFVDLAPVLELVYRNPDQFTGAVTVQVNPPSALWRVDGGAWLNSGMTTNVPVGNRTIEFGAVSGFVRPSSITARVIGGQTYSNSIVYQPLASVAVGPITFSNSPAGPLPDGASSRYIEARTVATHGPELFNTQFRTTRSVLVRGKTMVIEAGHPNGLYEEYDGAPDLRELSLHAETLIVRSPLRLPQTDVSLYARQLRFEMGGRIDTTPWSSPRAANATAIAAAEDGAHGADGGDINVFAETFAANSAGGPIFILNGAPGQAGGFGLDGSPGESRPTPCVRVVSEYGSPEPVPRRKNTVAVQVWEQFYLCEPIIGCVPIEVPPFFTTEHYSYCPSAEVWGSDEAWPTSGGNARSGGRPGNGGRGGTLTSSLRLVDFASTAGGVSARPTVSIGGAAGLPQPAYKFVDKRAVHFSLNLLGIPVFTDAEDDWYAQSDVIIGGQPTWVSPITHITQPGANAESPRASSEAGQPGEFATAGHSLSWLSPFALRMILMHAEDALVAGHWSTAESILTEYEALLTHYQSRGLARGLSADWQTEFSIADEQREQLRRRLAAPPFTPGTTVRLTASGTGAPRLFYQWLFNGQAIAGGTNATLTLTNFSFAHQGNYQVVVANAHGSVTSSVASVTVNLPSGFFRLQLLPGGNGEVPMAFLGEPGASYALDRTFTLNPATWVPVATNVADAAGTAVFVASPQPATNTFWRVRALR